MEGETATDQMFPGADPTSAAHRATDWSATPLGPVETWPAELRAAVRTVMPSRIPMLLWWSHELVQIFNDPYTSVLGEKFPAAVGQRAADCWAEIWDIVGPLTEQALSGESTYSHDQLLFMLRHGFLEETYWTFSYSPIKDAQGRVDGVFVATSEVTGRVVGDRRLALLRQLGELSIAAADSATDAVRAAARILAGGPADLPAGMVYLRQDQLDGADDPSRDGDEDVRLVASFGLVDGVERFAAAGPPTDVAEVLKTGRPVRVTGLTGTTWPTVRADGSGDQAPVDEAVALPLLATGSERPVGVLVLGISPYLALDEPYRHFLDLVASRVSTALTDVLAYEAQRRRAAALAELDAAKTAFFTDVSHELRTPLTLITGPVQESLTDEREPLPPAQRERLELVHRNAGRLHKLVNDMLDFARIEGGRLEAERVPTDLGGLTRGIADSFAYAMQQAGLTYEVDVRPLPRTGYVDRDMWEKVVVNLLSNALKYTLSGTVRLRLDGDEDTVTLSVSDTGVGIPADQQPLLFRRFYRVRGSGGRSHEGTGIGLALVQQLVRLHGGEVGVRSVEGEGSTFTVRIPYGRPTGERPGGGDRTLGSYRDEALRWVSETPSEPAAARAGGQVRPADAPTVLVVEDNPDLRTFLASLLAPAYRVLTAADGREALDLAVRELPDLVLTDVMMPRMDGFALLRALRTDRRTAGVPVIVLSARAGEEAAVEGLRAGADDYLPKPFSSPELLARVRAHLELARLRSREATWRSALIDSLQDAFAVYDEGITLLEANQAFCRLVGVDSLELPAPAPHPWWPDRETEPAEWRRVQEVAREMRQSDSGRFTVPLRHTDGHRVWVEVVYNALREPRTDQRLHVATLRDITAEVHAAAGQAAMATLATRLASASDITEVLGVGLAELGELLGGARGIAVCPDPAGAPVVVGAGLELTPQIRRTLDELAPESDPYLVRDGAGRVTAVAARIEAGGSGGIWLELIAPRPPAAVDRVLIRQLCGALSQALVRAHAYETQRAVSLAMQRAMLGPTELPSGFAVRYEPAVRPLEVGGDWYDVVPLAGDLVGVVVGDCVGRGLPAATVMGQLRSACRAMLLQAKSPAEVLCALDGFARLIPGAACTTLFCAIIDRARGEVRYSSAGHPPGILTNFDGAHELLDRAGSVPLASVAVRERPEATAPLRPGSTLLLYTDGLVERRRELIDAGIARAVDVLAASLALPEGELVDRLVRDLLPASGSDDAAVLVYRHRAPAVFTDALPADPAQLAPTRERLRRWLHAHGVTEWNVETVLIATGEACANAIEHGYRFAPGAITTLRAELRDGRLEIEVRDQGAWRESTDDAADGADRGRGRLIMARMMDEATIVGTPEGTTVRLVKRLSDGR